MNETELLQLLDKLLTGRIDKQAVVDKLKDLPYENLQFVKIDHHRALRQGFPEVVFCEGKTVEQISEILQHLVAKKVNILATRASQEAFARVKQVLPQLKYQAAARVIYWRATDIPVDESRYILVMTAGTSDIPVAEEAVITAEMMGNKAMRCYDVGVAGIHRLFAHKELIDKANVIIVAAGMDGALASVVGGLTDKPVIAVPTSIGYGASFHGLAALLSMLNSCSAGVGVVNIDNGFGAARLAHTINQMR